MNEREELLACPFCDGEAYQVAADEICCTKCDVMMEAGSDETPDQLRARWNKRIAVPAQGSREPLRQALEVAYRELKAHDADYHYRTPISVNNMIVDALAYAVSSTSGGGAA